MGFDIECIINIQSLAGEYFCPVCRLLVYPNEALQTLCTHLYCKPCLAYVANTTQACPYDGYLVTEADSKPLLESNKELAETIEKIQVHCLYQRSGCKWQGPFSECMPHCSGCAFGNSPVVCNRCGVQIVHRQVQEHAQSCPGVQPQTQQPGGVQNAAAVLDQAQPGSAAQVSSAQAVTQQASAEPLAAQDPGQQANSAAQANANQAALPTPEQLYQQQQYQQYYQQYPGYDPYQQQYQQYYPYQQQAAQQFQQPSFQGYLPNYPGQQQPLTYGQLQPQQQVHSQPPPLQTQPLPQPHSHVQSTANQQPVHPTGVAAPQYQGHGQATPNPQSQIYHQVQPYPQPRPTPPQLPQPVSQYPLAQGQMQYPLPQPQPQHQPHPHLQAQHFPQPQPQPPHSQPVAPPTSQPNHPQAQHPSTHAVTGYQSYPQPHGQPVAPPAMHAMRPHQQPPQPGQMQGQFPPQPLQVRPMMPNQQLPAMLASQAQPSSGPIAQRPPVHSHVQQAVYHGQQQPGMVPVQQTHQPAFHGSGPSVQQQTLIQGQLHGPGMAQAQPPVRNLPPPDGAPSSVPHSYSGRPIMSQNMGPQPYTQANAGHAMLAQINESSLTQKVNSQITAAVEYQSDHVEQPFKGVDAKDSSAATGNQSAEKKHLKPEIAMQYLEQKTIDEHNSESRLGSSSSDTKKMPPTNSELHALESDFAAQENKMKVKQVVALDKSETPFVQSDEMSSQENKDVHKIPEVLLPSVGDTRDGEPMDKAVQGASSGSVPALPQHNHTSGGSSSNLVPSTDHGKNQLQPIQHGHQQKFSGPTLQSTLHSGSLMGNASSQSRPQGPRQVFPSDTKLPIFKQPPGPVHPEYASGGVLGPGSAASFPRGPVNLDPPPYNLGGPYHVGQPRNPMGDPFRGPPFPAQPFVSLDSHPGFMGRGPSSQLPEGGFGQGPNMTEFGRFPVQRPRTYDGRRPDLRQGQLSGMLSNGSKFNNGPGNDPSSVSGMGDERMKLMPEGSLFPFPPEAGHHSVGSRDFGELKNLPRPSNLDAGPSGKVGAQFPSSSVNDPHAPPFFGSDSEPLPFEKAPHGVSHDSSRFLPLVHPGSSFHPADASGHPRPVGFHDDNIQRSDLGHLHPNFPDQEPGFGRRHREHLAGIPGSKQIYPSTDPLAKAARENRYPLPPADLFPPLSYSRAADVIGQNMLPNQLRFGEHFGPHNSHFGEGDSFGGFTNFGPPGESPLSGKYQPHLPFGDSLGGDRSAHPHLGEPGFRSRFPLRHTQDGGFRLGEMEPFDYSRKRKPGSVMCRICKVECETVEGLDLHSQSREHQEKAMAMVLSIKQQNSRKQKALNIRSLHGGGGKPRSAAFEGSGQKR